MNSPRYLIPVSVLLSAGVAQAGIRAPYTADANTVHLYQFETAAGATLAPNLGTAGRKVAAVNATSATGAPPTQTGILGDSSVAAPGFGVPAKITSATHLLGFDAGGTVDVYEGDVDAERIALSTLGVGVAGAATPFTLEALIRPGSATGNREIICTDSSAATRGFQFRLTTGGTSGQRLEFNLIGQASSQRFAEIPGSGDHAWALNEWFHVAFVYDGTNCRFYWTKLAAAPTAANQVGSDQAVTLTSGTITGQLVLGNENRAAAGEPLNGYLDQVRISNIARAASDFVFNSDPADSDGDGLLDAWENQHFGNITSQNGSGDFDSDGSTNEQEETAGSDPKNASSTHLDTDADGLADSWETSYFGGINAQTGADDTDHDFATNEQEESAGSNPTSAASIPDTDSDGLNDGWEILHFSNLAQSGSGDHDSDGANNAAEMAAGSDPKDAQWTPTKAKLAHRWTFNGDLLDSVGGSNATIVDPDSNAAVGGTASQNASEVTLTGGANGTSAYVNLGSNLLRGKKTPVTIELWATHNAVQNWGRIFDFSSSTTEYLFMSWTQGTNAATDQVEWIDSGVVTRLPNTNQPYTLGTKYHVVLTIVPAVNTAGALTGGSRVTWYTAPASNTAALTARGSFDTANHLAVLNDVNNWLGRSIWTGDNTSSATYDEVRIWNGALTSSEVNAYQLAGPNAFTLVDADSDGLPDPWETGYFGSHTLHNGSSDPDGDTFTNAQEYAAGSNPAVAASTPSDTDADTLPDSWEISTFGNLNQNATSDFDGDRATDLLEYTSGTNPKDNTNWPDSDGDSLNDGWEIFYFGSVGAFDSSADPDQDGQDNFSEYWANTDPTNGDRDFDGLLDTWEITYFTNTTAHDGSGDPDSDGFTNAQEYAGKSDPTNFASRPGDVNGDGIADGHILAVGDAADTTSFNSGLNWADTLAPAAGENYLVSVQSLRTPTDAADYTFAGANLVLYTGGNLLVKGTGVLTIPTLRLDGGRLHNGTNANAVVTVNGGIVVSRASEIYAQNNGFVINSAVSGSSNLSITGNSGNSVTFGGANTWTGSLSVATGVTYVLGNTSTHCFVPGASGTTNVIGGAGSVTLNGAFVIDTASASTTSGSTWTLVSATGTKTYGATFTVTGFTADGGAVGARKWTKSGYQYDEATHTLSVTATATPLQSWRQTNFGTTANSGNAADAADFDGDGRANLLEYATGTNPTVANSGAVVAVAKSGSFLSLAFDHIGDASLTYVVEASNDLATWSTVQSYSGLTAAGQQTYVDNVPLTGPARRFLRLRVQY